MLSHPLLADAIETHFVPCCIYNNIKGRDAEILKRYKEPAFNNPVVRYVRADGTDVIPRRDRVWTLSATAARMRSALAAASEGSSRSATLYLRLLAEENVKTRKLATFAMHCFWEGEVHLGGLDGVTLTRAGWLDGKEVVEVEFDETVLGYEQLVKKAREMKCATTVFAHDQAQLEVAKKLVGKDVVLSHQRARDAKYQDRLYHLRRTFWNSVPATGLQRVRMNVALAKREDPAQFLAPHQLGLAKRIQAAGFENVKGVEPPPDAMYLDVYQDKLVSLLVRIEARQAGKAGEPGGARKSGAAGRDKR